MRRLTTLRVASLLGAAVSSLALSLAVAPLAAYGATPTPSPGIRAVVTNAAGVSYPVTTSESVTKLSVAAGVTYYRAVLDAVVVLGTSSPTSRPHVSPAISGFSCQDDGSISVEGCITLYYNIINNCYGADRCAEITSATTSYTNLAPGAAVLNTGDWTEGASGPCHSGCGSYVAGTHDFGSHAVTSGTNYSYTGHWNATYTVIQNLVGAERGGITTLHWHYRGTAETLTFQYNIPDN